MKKDINKSQDPETESFNRAMKFALIVYAVIEILILLLIICFKLSKVNN